MTILTPSNSDVSVSWLDLLPTFKNQVAQCARWTSAPVSPRLANEALYRPIDF